VSGRWFDSIRAGLWLLGNFHDRLKVWSVGLVVFEGVRLDVDYLVDATDG